MRGYIDFLFDPAHPAQLRVLPDTPLAHPLRDSSVAAYQHVTPAAVSSQRKQYTALLHKMMVQMQGRRGRATSNFAKYEFSEI